MHHWVFLLLLPFISLSAEEAPPLTPQEACAQEIEKMDKQIEKLQSQKKQHLDLAQQYQTKGDQWQYNTGRIEDAYYWWGKANDERRKAINIQSQIDLMNERKARIYQFYPELYQRDL